MSWIRKVFIRTPEPEEQTVLQPSPELAAAQKRHKELLNRADQAIKEAMDHADEMFEPEPPKYRGPDRRERPR